MTELMNLLFSPAGLIPTLLLIFVIIYWVTVIVGALDTGFMDFDIDIDVDVDVDVDVDLDAAGGIDGGIAWFNHVLYFFNLGRIPFMVWLSFVSLCLFLFVLTINDLLGISSFLPGLMVLLPGLIASLLVAKVLTIPLIKVFAELDGETLNVDLEGKIGRVKLPIFPDSVGQITINVDDKSFVVEAYIRTSDKVEKGTSVLVINYNKERNAYLVEPYIH
jgi:hypothetical protein